MPDKTADAQKGSMKHAGEAAMRHAAARVAHEMTRQSAVLLHLGDGLTRAEIQAAQAMANLIAGKIRGLQ